MRLVSQTSKLRKIVKRENVCSEMETQVSLIASYIASEKYISRVVSKKKVRARLRFLKTIAGPTYARVYFILSAGRSL